MVFVSFLGLVLIAILSTVYARIRLPTSILICSIFSVCTFVGVTNSLGFVFYFLAVLNYIFWRRLNLNVSGVLWFLLFIVVLYPVVFLSMDNGASFGKNILKYFQTVVVFGSLIFLIESRDNLSGLKVKKFVTIFILVNLFLGAFSHVLFNPYDLGIIRFSGIFFDSNYFGLHLLVLYYLVDISKVRNVGLKICLFVLIVGTLSLSIVMLFILYATLKRFLIPLFQTSSSFFVVSVCSFLAYVSIMFLIESYAEGATGSQFITYKLMSLTHRLEAQFEALRLLEDYSAFFSGMGSGRNIELTGLALHNSFLQMVFSHGVFYFLLLTLILTAKVKLTKVLAFNYRKQYFAMLYCLLVACFVLDPVITLYFHMILFFSYKETHGL